MTEQEKCAKCGSPLPSGVRGGLCPACLLKRGLETNTVGYTEDACGTGFPARESANWTPPTVEQLAPLFPELDVLELIGRGGMGAVYKAREKQLDRLVALKVLPPELVECGGRAASAASRDDAALGPGAPAAAEPKRGQGPRTPNAFAQRFAREAQAMAKLGHPNIVTIYSFGSRGSTGVSPVSPTAVPPVDKEIDHGQDARDTHGQDAHATDLYFFIMEYVDGLSLRQLLDAGTVSPKEALAIVPQICEALQYAHDRGIVHRDIKPENILLNRAGQVKIADFGLAKLVGGVAGVPPARDEAVSASRGQEEREQDARGTRGQDARDTIHATQHVMGTPQYMAPEQIERPGEVDHRADIYSLGVVFYQMLTGELPKGRPGEAFEPPSRKVVIDVRLDEVVLRALEREPARRYQQVSEVRTEVETIVATQTPPSRQESPSRQQGKRGNRETLRSAWQWTKAKLSFALPLVEDRNGKRAIRWSNVALMAVVIVGASFLALVILRLILGLLVVTAVVLLPVAIVVGVVAGIVILIRKVVRGGIKRPLPPPNSSQQSAPQFSRLAIVGAAWTPVTFLAVFLCITAAAWISGGLSRHVVGGFVILLGVLGLPAFFGTTICGAVSISQIRHSAGRLYGLGLALFDALLFPLLILNGLIFWGIHAVMDEIAQASLPPPIVTPHGTVTPATSVIGLALFVTIVLCAILDSLIIRWAWRAAKRPLADAAALPTSSGGAATPVAQPTERARQPVKPPAIGLIVAAGINFLSLIAFLVLPLILLSQQLTGTQGTMDVPWAIQAAADVSLRGVHIFSWAVPMPAIILISMSIDAVVVFGALGMVKLRNRWLAITAAIMAAIALPGSIIGLPMGIWALVVLTRRETVQGFQTIRAEAAKPHPEQSAQAVKLPGIIVLFIRLVYVLAVLVALWPFFGAGMDPDEPKLLQIFLICLPVAAGIAFVGGVIALLCGWIVKRIHDGRPPLGRPVVPLSPARVFGIVAIWMGAAYLAGRVVDRMVVSHAPDEISISDDLGAVMPVTQPATQSVWKEAQVAEDELNALKARESALQGQLAELREKLGFDDPAARQVEASLVALRLQLEVKRLEQELRYRERSLLIAEMQGLRGTKYEYMLDGLQKDIDETRKLLEEAKAREASLPSTQPASGPQLDTRPSIPTTDKTGLTLLLSRDDRAGGGASGPHFRLTARNDSDQAMKLNKGDIQFHCIDAAGRGYGTPLPTTRDAAAEDRIAPGGERLLRTTGCGGDGSHYSGWGPKDGGFVIWATGPEGLESNRIRVELPTTRPATQPAADGWGEKDTVGLRIRLVIPADAGGQVLLNPDRCEARLELWNTGDKPIKIAQRNRGGERAAPGDEWPIGLGIQVKDAYLGLRTFRPADEQGDHMDWEPIVAGGAMGWVRIDAAASFKSIQPGQRTSLNIRLDRLFEGDDPPTNLLTLRGRRELRPMVLMNKGESGLWPGGADGDWVTVSMPTAPVKVFRSPAEVLGGLPADAHPDPREGWDEFSKPKADKWLKSNVSGRGFDVVFDAVVKNVELKRISPKGQTTETIRWDALLTLERIPFEFNGRKLALKLDSYTPSDPNATTHPLHLGDAVVTVSGDETFARRAKALAAGDKVSIRGTISKAAEWNEKPPELWILLSDPSVVLPTSAGATVVPLDAPGDPAATAGPAAPAGKARAPAAPVKFVRPISLELAE